MQGSIRCVVVAGVLSACSPGATDTPPPDVPDVPGTSGLVIEWSSSPADWPSASVAGISLQRARFALDSLRVVGDASPGDPRTTASAVIMDWDAQQRPASITFDDAPPGLYSQVALAFESPGDGDTYRIDGKVEVGGDVHDFRIEDTERLTFNVAIDEMLSPGEQAVISLRVNFILAIQSVDWANVEASDGRKELEDDDPEMAAFRTKLVESFEIVNTANVD